MQKRHRLHSEFISPSLLLLLLLALQCTIQSSKCSVLPAIVSRTTDSIAAMLASGRQQQQQQMQPLVGIPPQLQQQHQQQQPQQPQQIPLIPEARNGSVGSLQAQLNAMQTQAQRQLSQLNGLMLSGASQLASSPLVAHAANLTGANTKYNNVLEVLSNVGKAIQQQISGSQNGANIRIITAPTGQSMSSTVDGIGGGQSVELANNKKNEYQSIVVNDNQQLNVGQQPQPQQQQLANSGPINGTINYREQGELIRQEIVRRAGQLQQVVATSMDVLKNNGDLIVRRLLEQLNNRLDQAKSKADKIISEPATNEMAIKGLMTINQGLNNLNNIITNLVNRLDINSKDANQISNGIQIAANQQQVGASQRLAGGGGGSASSLLDSAARFRLNFHQLGQQFSTALNAVQQQQKLQQQQQPQSQPIPAI